MKSVIIFGSDGQLGKELEVTAPEGIKLYLFNKSSVNISDLSKVKKVVSEINPDVIINAAAYTNVDRSELESELAYNVNTVGAENCAIVSKIFNAKLIHISTNYVYDGYSNKPYTTTDSTTPLNIYGFTKLQGEERITSILDDNYIIFRTSWLYSINGNSFVRKIISKLLSHDKEISVIKDIVSTPTYARYFAIGIWNSVFEEDMTGIYHWSDMGVCSYYDLAVAIHKNIKSISAFLNDVDIYIKPVSSESHSTLALRPRYSVLECSPTYDIIGTAKYWDDALRSMLVNYFSSFISPTR